MRIFVYILLLILIPPLSSCASTSENALSGRNWSMRKVTLHKGDNLIVVMAKANTIYEVKENINLNGKNIAVGKNCLLKFNGGSLRNGTIIGSNTKIERVNNGIFDKIHFKGSWSVPEISSDMWKSLNYPNSLQDVFALLNGDVQNKVVLKKYGYYYQLAAGPKGGILNIADNTELIVNGDVVLRPNSYNGYELIRVTRCTNIKIHGKGSISGDRLNHDYTSTKGSHEYGHCFVFRGAHNVDISGITLKNFTGDALCLMDNCSNFKIHDMIIKDCRRCGVSIRADHDVVIDNCTFSGIVNDKYNQPSAAVDIEPVVECKVFNISIKNCRFYNNARGISSAAKNYYGGRYKKGDKILIEKRKYLNLDIANCEFKNSTYTSFISPFGWDRLTITDCTFYNGRQEDIRVAYTMSCIVKNCKTTSDNNRASRARSFISNFYENRNVRVVNCNGDNIKRVFSDNKNCQMKNSVFKL